MWRFMIIECNISTVFHIACRIFIRCNLTQKKCHIPTHTIAVQESGVSRHQGSKLSPSPLETPDITVTLRIFGPYWNGASPSHSWNPWYHCNTIVYWDPINHVIIMPRDASLLDSWLNVFQAGYAAQIDEQFLCFWLFFSFHVLITFVIDAF